MPLHTRTDIIKKSIRALLFSGKWLLIPFYLGLIVAQGIYCLKFCEQTLHLCAEFSTLDESKILLAVLNMIDVTMVATLITMIIKGSYTTFVDGGGDKDHDQSGVLKVKMACSLIAVSSIHLLQAFIDAAHVPTREIAIKCSIHLIFLTSAFTLGAIDYMHCKCDNSDKH